MTTGMVISILIFLPLIILVPLALYAMEVPYEERQARHYDRLAARQYKALKDDLPFTNTYTNRLELARQLEEIAEEWRDETEEE